MEFIASPNFASGRRGLPIKYVVIHTTQGSFNGTIEWFKNPQSRVSAHYIIGKDGKIVQMVKEEDRAWHVGLGNAVSLGIEHEGDCNDPNWITEPMLETSSKLVASLMKKYKLSIKNVIGHNDPIMRLVFRNSHTDPGLFMNWSQYRQLIVKELGNV